MYSSSRTPQPFKFLSSDILTCRAMIGFDQLIRLGPLMFVPGCGCNSWESFAERAAVIASVGLWCQCLSGGWFVLSICSISITSSHEHTIFVTAHPCYTYLPLLVLPKYVYKPTQKPLQRLQDETVRVNLGHSYQCPKQSNGHWQCKKDWHCYWQVPETLQERWRN